MRACMCAQPTVCMAKRSRPEPILKAKSSSSTHTGMNTNAATEPYEAQHTTGQVHLSWLGWLKLFLSAKHHAGSTQGL